MKNISNEELKKEIELLKLELEVLKTTVTAMRSINKSNTDISKLIIDGKKLSSIVCNSDSDTATVSTLKHDKSKIECLFDGRVPEIYDSLNNNLKINNKEILSVNEEMLKESQIKVLKNKNII